MPLRFLMGPHFRPLVHERLCSSTVYVLSPQRQQEPEVHLLYRYLKKSRIPLLSGMVPGIEVALRY